MNWERLQRWVDRRRIVRIRCWFPNQNIVIAGRGPLDLLLLKGCIDALIRDDNKQVRIQYSNQGNPLQLVNMTALLTKLPGTHP